MSGRPSSWSECAIGDVCRVVGGGTPSSSDPTNFTVEGGTPWITPADLSGYRDKYIDHGRRNLSQKGLANSSAKVMPAGTVLFSSRAPVGYVAIAANPISTNQGFKSFLVPAGLDSSYLYYYLRHIKPEAEARATGTTFKELSGAAAARLPLIIAPSREQPRIGTKLDAILSRVDACRGRLDRVPQILKGFRAAVLEAAVSGRLTEEWRTDNTGPSEQGSELSNQSDGQPFPIPETWRWSSLGAVSSNYDNRRVPIRASDRAKRPGIYPYYGAFGVIDSIDAFQYEGTYLLIAEDGKNLESRERPIAVIASGRFWVNNHAHVIQAKSGLDLEYLAHYVNSQALDLQSHLTGIDQVKLTRSALDGLPVPVPPVSEAQEIVRRVFGLFALADRLDAHHAAALSRVVKLTPSTLAKAFCGQLVPQDPNDEPAETLLNRVRLVGGASRAGKVRRGKRPRNAV